MGPNIAKPQVDGFDSEFNRRFSLRDIVNFRQKTTNTLKISTEPSIKKMLFTKHLSVTGRCPMLTSSQCTKLAFPMSPSMPAVSPDEAAILDKYRFSLEEVKLLRETFERLKDDRCEMSRQMVLGVNASVPAAQEYYQTARDRLGDDWAFMNIGLIVMSGIERCLLRVGSPLFLEETVKRLKQNHSTKYGVPITMMLHVVEASSTIFKQQVLTLCHDPPVDPETSRDHNCDSSCKTCCVWDRFFELLIIQFKKQL